jgi:hypothetical protein
MSLNPTRICDTSLPSYLAAQSVEDFEALLPSNITRDN